jgi:hypothetical protein
VVAVFTLDVLLLFLLALLVRNSFARAKEFCECCCKVKERYQMINCLKLDFVCFSLRMQGAPTNPVLEVSVCDISLSRQFKEIEGVFPDLFFGDGGKCRHLHAIITMQESAFDLVSRSPGAEREKESHCERFLRWARVIVHVVRMAGFWGDMPDPATGYPVLGRRGGFVHNELDCVLTSLKYSASQVGSCCVLEHPRWGTRCYPASMFVVAPRALIDDAIARANVVDADFGKPFSVGQKTSETGLFVVMPRALWPPFNEVREEFFEDLRLGPHLSIVDPFVVKSELDRAWLVLSASLSNFSSFVLRFRRLDVMVHSATSCTVYAVPVKCKKENGFLSLFFSLGGRSCWVFAEPIYAVVVSVPFLRQLGSSGQWSLASAFEFGQV